MSDETRRRLEEAGSRPVQPPDPAFAERLEARLSAPGRAAHLHPAAQLQAKLIAVRADLAAVGLRT